MAIWAQYIEWILLTGLAVLAACHILRIRIGSMPSIARTAAMTFWVVFILYSALLVLLVRTVEAFPIGNFSQALIFAIYFLLLLARIIEYLFGDKSFSFVIYPVIAILFAGSFLLRENPITVPAELRGSLWPIHVAFALLGYIMLFLAATGSVSYIFKFFAMKRRIRSTEMINNLPALEVLKRLVVKSTIIGVALLILGVVVGIIWLRISGIDIQWKMATKFTMSLLTIGVYLIYLALYKRDRLSQRDLSFVNVLGFMLIIITFFIGNHGF